LPARLERIQPAEGGDYPLADLAADPPTLGDLEIDASAGDLLAEVHRRSHVERTNSRNTRKESTKIYQ
jgi:hypothetical protein